MQSTAHANAYAERFVRSIKEECLDRLIPFGERHFRRAVAEYVAHYHRERNHQGLGNELIDGPPAEARVARVRRRQPSWWAAQLLRTCGVDTRISDLAQAWDTTGLKTGNTIESIGVAAAYGGNSCIGMGDSSKSAIATNRALHSAEGRPRRGICQVVDRRPITAPINIAPPNIETPRNQRSAKNASVLCWPPGGPTSHTASG